jgi:hypothetical protein
MIRGCKLMREKIIFLLIFIVKVLLYSIQCLNLDSSNMNGPVQHDINLQPAEINPADFPSINILSINCNSFNMSAVTKHVRLRKFYGICSLKSDIIFMCDLRMYNKAGLTDLKFAYDTFAMNPYRSYNFIYHSTTNSGILVKKSLNFDYLEMKRDEEDDNFILLRTKISNITVILGSIYGPNKKDDNFFRRLRNALSGLGNHPTVIGGDWNATFSCLPLQDNPDVLFMQDVPNLQHSKKIREICRDFNLSHPFRILYPIRLEYMFLMVQCGKIDPDSTFFLFQRIYR